MTVLTRSNNSHSKPLYFLHSSTGFTIIELLTVVVIIGILATIAFAGYLAYVEKAKTVTAKSEINTIEKEIYIWGVDKSFQFPPSLCEPALGFNDYCNFLDPWNRPYIYQPDLTPAAVPSPRQKAGVNINTDYDLYSFGKDGLSAQDIAAPESRDDIIRAGDGAYKGFAKGY